MKLKKMLSVALSLAMAMSLSLPVCAGDTTSLEANERETTVTTTVEVPTLSVTVGGTSNIIVNPYRLDIQSSTGASAADTSPVYFAPVEITNDGDVPLNVSVTVTGSIPDGSNASFASAALKNSTKNEVFLYGEFCTPYIDLATSGTVDGTPTWPSAYNSKTALIVAKDKAASLKNIVTLEAPSASDNTNANENAVAFRLTGDANGTPTTPWTADDKVDVKVIFAFEFTTITQ